MQHFATDSRAWAWERRREPVVVRAQSTAKAYSGPAHVHVCTLGHVRTSDSCHLFCRVAPRLPLDIRKARLIAPEQERIGGARLSPRTTMAGNSISAVPEALLSVNSQQPFKGHALGVGLHTICQVCAQVTVAASDMMKLPGTESWLEETCTTTVREWLDRVEKKSCHLCYLLFQNVTRFDSEFHWWEPSLNLELIVSVWTTKSSLVLTPRIQREGKLAWQRPMSPPDPILIYNSAWSKGTCMLART